MTAIEKRVARICGKFADDLQRVFDAVTDDAEIEAMEASAVCDLAVTAQSYARDTKQEADQ